MIFHESKRDVMLKKEQCGLIIKISPERINKRPLLLGESHKELLKDYLSVIQNCLGNAWDVWEKPQHVLGHTVGFRVFRISRVKRAEHA
jgi:hypothetical protein